MNGYLSPEQVALGRLVVDMKNPGQNFCPHSTLKLGKGDISKNAFDNIHALANTESSNYFRATLSKLLSIFATQSKTSVDKMETEKAFSYQLLNTSDRFESLLDDNEPAKRWLDKILRRTSVYMVVGLHTICDGSIDLNHDSSMEVSGKVHFPGDAVTPGTGGAADVKLEGGHTGKASTAVSFVASGERIVAVAYQKVTFGMFSSKSVDDAYLQKRTRWISFEAERATTDLDGTEVTLLENTGPEEVKDNRRVKIEAESVAEGDDRGIFIILS
jgi:hypothetical protein